MNALPFCLVFPRPEAALTSDSKEDLSITGRFQKTLEELDEELAGEAPLPPAAVLHPVALDPGGCFVPSSSMQLQEGRFWVGEHSPRGRLPSGLVLWGRLTAAHMLSGPSRLCTLGGTPHTSGKQSSPAPSWFGKPWMTQVSSFPD